MTTCPNSFSKNATFLSPSTLCYEYGTCDIQRQDQIQKDKKLSVHYKYIFNVLLLKPDTRYVDIFNELVDNWLNNQAVAVDWYIQSFEWKISDVTDFVCRWWGERTVVDMKEVR